MTDFILARVDQARQLLAQARDASDAKKVSDLAHAAEIYAKRQRMGEEAINYAHAIVIEAQRMLGEFLREAPRASVGRPEKIVESDDHYLKPPPTLAQIGITKDESSNAQALAAIAQQAPEIYEAIRENKTTVQVAKREIKERGREQVRESNRALVAQAVPLDAVITKEYQTIVLDPPWDWGDEGDCDQLGRSRPTYGTMSFEEIKELPVGELASRNAHLYLWITNRSLPKGFALLDAWGFRYITCLTWCKPSIGMGNYFRGSSEQVLFGVRGSLPLLRRDMGTWFAAPRPGRHSAKPDEFYPLVETCSPGPWLEMFARSERSGWVSWGAEV